MARFINIAKDDTKPVLVNIEDIACVEEGFPGMALGQTQHSIRITGMDGREKAHLSCDGYNIDVDVAVAKMAAAGLDLVHVPVGWPDNGAVKAVGRNFVNPASFQYIITSKPTADKGATEETSAVLLSLRGNFIQTYGITEPMIDGFMAKVVQALPQVKHVDTAKMTARFYQMGRIAYNPAAITSVDQGSDRVDVRFAGATIDFNAPHKDWCNEYLNRKHNKATPEKRAAFMRAVWNNPAVDTQKHIYGFENKIRDRIGREFARAVAADVPQLIKVGGDFGAHYNRLDDVATMSLYDTKEGNTVLSVLFSRSNNDGVHVTFKTREKAEKEMARIAGILSAPKL